MTPDQIEQLARKAGGRPFVDEGNPGKPLFKFRQKQLAKFVALLEHERKQSALQKMADNAQALGLYDEPKEALPRA